MIHRMTHFLEQQGVWKGTGWGLAAMITVDGVSLLILGNRIAAGPSFSLLGKAPWGMHSVGFIMCVIATMLWMTVHKRDHGAQIALYCAFVMGVVLVCYTIGGWIYADTVAISAITKWFLLAWLALWLSATTSRPGGPRHVRS